MRNRRSQSGKEENQKLRSCGIYSTQTSQRNHIFARDYLSRMNGIPKAGVCMGGHCGTEQTRAGAPFGPGKRKKPADESTKWRETSRGDVTRVLGRHA